MEMRNIIIINGAGAVGKDTFVSEYEKISSFQVFNHSTISEAKRILASIGLSDTKTDEFRNILHDVKILLVKYGDRPFNQSKKFIESVKSSLSDSAIFIHCREGSEIQKLVDFYGDMCMTLLIKRSGIDVPDCPADKNVEKYFGYNMVIEDFDLKKMEEYKEELEDLIYDRKKG